MKYMSLEKRVFLCFFILILFLSSGCHTTKYEWFPNRDGTDPDVNKVGLKDRRELGGIEVDVLKISF
jgi:hypothetical protein